MVEMYSTYNLFMNSSDSITVHCDPIQRYKGHTVDLYNFVSTATIYGVTHLVHL